MAAQKYTNLAQGIIDSAYTAGDSSLVLNTGEGAAFPSTGDFMIAIGDPPEFFLKCTARSTDTLTVSTTGQEGTTCVSKAVGTRVTHVITAGALDNIRSDISKAGVAASLPTSGMKDGDIYRATNAPIAWRHNGTIWVPFGPLYPLLLPVLASFTNLSGAATVTDTGAGVTVTGSNNQATIYYKAAPGATPFNVTIGFLAYIGPEDFGQVVLLGREAATDERIEFGLQHSGANGLSVVYNKNNAGGGFAAQYKISGAWRAMGACGLVFLRFRDDGTNRLAQLSMDGQNFTTFHSTTRTDFLTADQYGFAAGGSTNYPPNARIIHFDMA